MTTLATLLVRLTADTSSYTTRLEAAAGLANKVGQSLMGTGAMLTAGVTLPLAAAAGVAVKAFVDLDREMRNIQSISKQDEASLGELQDTFIALSTDMTKTTDSAVNLAAGFYQIQSSGFAGEDAMTVLLASTKAATAGLTETGVAAQAISAKLNAYGEGADQAALTSDLMFRTVDRGVLTFEELSSSLSNVIGTSANAGIGFDVISAAIATMTKQGMTASEATVSLNQMILSIIDPGEKLKQVFADLGYESGAAALEQLGLAGTLNALTTAGYDTTDEMAQLFGNVRSLKGALALSGEGAQMFADDLESMGDAAGATEAAFAIQTQSLAAQIDNLKNKATAFGLELAEIALPAIEKAIETAQGWLDQLRALPVATQENILKIGLFVAALGPVMTVIGGLITSIGTMIGVINSLKVAMAAANISAIGAASAFAAVALAIIAVVGAYMKWQELQKVVSEGQQDVANRWTAFFEEQASSGAAAGTVIDGFIERQQRVRAVLDSTNPVLRAFMGNQQALLGDYGQLSTAVLETSNSYEEYVEGLTRAAAAGEMGLDANGNLYDSEANLVQANYILTEQQFRMATAVQHSTDAAYGMTGAFAAMTAAGSGATAASDEFATQLAEQQAAAEAATEAQEAMQAQLDLYHLFLQGPVGAEIEDFNAKNADARVKMAELRDKIAELEGLQYRTSEQEEELAGLKGQVEEVEGAVQNYALAHQAATRSILLDLLEQQMGMDGWQEGEMDALMAVAERWGLIDDATAEAWEGVSEVLSDWNGQADTLIADMDALDRKLRGLPTDTDVNININVHGAIPYIPDFGVGGDPTSDVTADPERQVDGKFATGTSNFVVPPGFENDTWIGAFSSGETLNVTPRGGQPGGGNMTFNNSFVGDAGDALDDRRRARMYAEEIRRSGG